MPVVAMAPKYFAVMSPSVSVLYVLILALPHLVNWHRKTHLLLRKRVMLSVYLVVCLIIAPDLWRLASFAAIHTWVIEGGILLTLSSVLSWSRQQGQRAL